MTPIAPDSPKQPQTTDGPDQWFSKSLRALMDEHGITGGVMRRITIRRGGVDWSPGRETLRRALKGVRQEGGTREALVEVLRRLKPQELASLSPAEMMSPEFDVARYRRRASTTLAAPLDVQALEGVLGQIAAGSRSREEWLNGVLEVSIDVAKNEVARKMRAVIRQTGMGNRAFNDFLYRVGIPDELPLPAGQKMFDFAARIDAAPHKLKANHSTMWRIVTAMYPEPPATTDQELKAPLRYLAKYWDRSLLFARRRWGVSFAKDLAAARKDWRPLVFLVSWLELRLAIETGDQTNGKYDLFLLAKGYMEQRL